MPNLADLLRNAATRLKECGDIPRHGDSCERAIDDALKTRPGSLEKINAAIAAANKEKQSWPPKIQESQKLVAQLNSDKTPAAIDAAKKLDAAAKSANSALADLTKKITEAGKFQTGQQTDDKSAERALETNMAATNDAIGELAQLLALQMSQRRQLASAVKAAVESSGDAAAVPPLISALQTSNRELEQLVKTGEKIYTAGGPIVTDAMASFTNKLREAGLRLDRLHNDLDRDIRKGKDSILQSTLDLQKAQTSTARAQGTTP